ncbi:pentapeptide repeat-containing protein [Streptomyces griseoluteus]|uniref:pentapeptide repeat-containing protein n=1 Tax=Streptomyces griseoluteus TaxID=29306 RepID=UPI0036F5CF09
MVDSTSLLRASCHHEGCQGSTLPGASECLEHINEEAFEAYLAGVRSGDNLTFRQSIIHARRLQRILEATRNDRGRIEIGRASFQGSSFFGEIRFSSAIFHQSASFLAAQFKHSASFDGCTFEDQASFSACTFVRSARFTTATFKSMAHFAGTKFEEGVSFTEATFFDKARFSDCNCNKAAKFIGARFQGKAKFKRAKFDDISLNAVRADQGITFYQAHVDGDFRIAGAYIQSSLSLSEANFSGTSKVGPISCSEALIAVNTTWKGRVNVSIATPMIDLTGARFEKQLDLSARHAKIAMPDTHFGMPSMVTGVTRLLYSTSEGGRRAISEHQLPEGSIRTRPSITTVSGADLSNLTLSNVDVRRCKFIESHNLEKLHIEGNVLFGGTPRGFTFTHKRPLSLWWSPRRVIAEERHWRRSHGWRSSWPWDGSTTYRITPSPELVSHIYRSLRRAHEESKNEPGAADFYYGEMEMRRHSKSAPKIERATIWAYWAICGYGLRASRAVAALILLILGATYVVNTFGLTAGSASFSGTLRFLIESSISLKTDNNGIDANLNAIGASLRIFLRIAVPALFGLSLLAVRNRIKR